MYANDMIHDVARYNILIGNERQWEYSYKTGLRMN